MEIDKIFCMDCLVGMKQIPDGTIDAVICDLPYGTTACAWDSVIPLDKLWAEYNRIVKPNGAIVLFGQEPFSILMRIKVGIGTNGDIYADLEKVKACNFCTHFEGYGLHACAGHCCKLNKDIGGGYIGNYNKVAKECSDFNVKPELIEIENE